MTQGKKKIQPLGVKKNEAEPQKLNTIKLNRVKLNGPVYSRRAFEMVGRHPAPHKRGRILRLPEALMAENVPEVMKGRRQMEEANL